MNSKIAALMPFVDFLGAALGSATEVVLHDLTEPENSVVKIVNGHVSGRNVGAPATDFARAIVREYGDSNINFVTDYVCKTVDGRPLQGSSYFIRDEGEVVGMICVNIDPQPFRSLEDALNVFMEAYRHGGSEEYRDANLDAVRAAYSSSSVETLSLGGNDAGVVEQVRASWPPWARRPRSLTRPAAWRSSASSRRRVPSLSRARRQTWPASCTSRCPASTATSRRSAGRARPLASRR